jgi:hypothetical protein
MRVLLASVVLAALTRAHGARAEHTVDFRADRVEIAPDAGSLALSGSVVVRLARFRLTSEAVKLSRSPRGVHVEGKGELGLCACAKPPVTFGFQGADLAPPTDVLLQGATLRVASVPVFWSPYLWLRAPERTGVLPPSLAYRGEDIEPERRCPTCGKTLKLHVQVCTRCGTDLEMPPVEETRPGPAFRT